MAHCSASYFTSLWNTLSEHQEKNAPWMEALSRPTLHTWELLIGVHACCAVAQGRSNLWGGVCLSAAGVHGGICTWLLLSLNCDCRECRTDRSAPPGVHSRSDTCLGPLPWPRAASITARTRSGVSVWLAWGTRSALLHTWLLYAAEPGTISRQPALLYNATWHNVFSYYTGPQGTRRTDVLFISFFL